MDEGDEVPGIVVTKGEKVKEAATGKGTEVSKEKSGLVLQRALKAIKIDLRAMI